MSQQDDWPLGASEQDNWSLGSTDKESVEGHRMGSAVILDDSDSPDRDPSNRDPSNRDAAGSSVGRPRPWTRHAAPRGRGYGRAFMDQPISAGDVRMLACDARVIPAVLGGPSEPLDLGRANRLATLAQVTALRLRDRGCSFPGCDMPPEWTDAHHLVHWADGGPTDLTNLALLCRHHHRVTHQKGYVGIASRSGVEWDLSLPGAVNTRTSAIPA